MTRWVRHGEPRVARPSGCHAQLVEALSSGKESGIILDLPLELRARRAVSIILIAHNFAQVFEVCDRINLLRHGRIDFDRRSRAPRCTS